MNELCGTGTSSSIQKVATNFEEQQEDKTLEPFVWKLWQGLMLHWNVDLEKVHPSSLMISLSAAH